MTVTIINICSELKFSRLCNYGETAPPSSNLSQTVCRRSVMPGLNQAQIASRQMRRLAIEH